MAPPTSLTSPEPLPRPPPRFGPNGAGKTTLVERVVSVTGLPFVNADLIARASNTHGDIRAAPPRSPAGYI